MLSLHGVGLEVPPGWDVAIRPGAAALPAQGRALPGTVVLHAGTFPLPAQRGDFGSGAVEAMEPGDVLVVLFEYGRESSGTALFRHAGPPRLTEGDFAAGTMPRRMRRRVGVQQFFAASGRAFCLHVVLAARAADPQLVATANALVSEIRIEG